VTLLGGVQKTLYFGDQREITLSVSKGDFERIFEAKIAKDLLRQAQDDFCLRQKVLLT
jgi:hypothetical protein